MKTTVLEPETWKRVIEFDIPAEEVGAAVDAKLDEFRKSARLPGFRQGKVPISVIRQRFGEAARAEVIENLIKDSYKNACEEHKIEPVCGATVTDMKEGAGGEPLRFTIETEVDPPIEIVGYDSLKIRAKPKKITDSDADANYASLLERFAEYTNVERPSKKGDCIRVEYRKVVIDGEERPELRNHNPSHPIELGAEGVFKEFDKGLTGVSAGDEVEISVKFPKDYGDAGAAGKTGVFSVTVLSVQEKSLPVVNDEFLKKFGDFGDVSALKAELRKSLEESEADRAKKEAHSEAIEALIRDNPFEVPPSRIEAFVNMMIEDQAQGRPVPEDQRAQLAEVYRAPAEKALKRIRIVDYVADKEKIKATQEEVDREIESLAQRYGHEFDQLKLALRKNGTVNRLRLEIRERKTLDFLIGVDVDVLRV